MSNYHNIAVFTSGRSEYGLLSPVLKKLLHDPLFDLKLMVGGGHLVQRFGHTIDEIEKDGYSPDVKLPFLREEKEENAETRSMARLLQLTGEYFFKSPPDLLLILGDRFELLPVVSAALVQNIPVGHISGGEFTEGSIDNQVRHAVTKMAHVHFPAHSQAADNIEQMGEERWRILTSGEPGLDLILSLEPINREDLFKDLQLDPDKEVIISTFHSETIQNSITPSFLEQLFTQITQTSNYQVVVTAANFDQGGEEINKTLICLAEKLPGFRFFTSLGQHRYYSLLRYASLMLGNSSSGIVEAQSFGLPVVNVGKRQQGRLFNPNVIQTSNSIAEVMEGIKKAQSEEFKKSFRNKTNYYGSGNSAEKIVNFIKTLPDAKKLLLKRGWLGGK